MKRALLLALSLTAAVAVPTLLARRGAAAPAPAPARAELVARGQYLTNTMACYDCHTPWAMTPEGPRPDPKRWLSGHPESVIVATAPAPLPSPWAAAVSETMTAWTGPWGVSFTANLTPDPETGLGAWTFDDFRAAIRTGRHRGKGRPILPPMPAHAYAKLTDADLEAIFAYLQSLPPIRNRVPEPLPPAEAPVAPTPGK